MADKPYKTLDQMAAEAAAATGGGLVCPKCNCHNFKTYGGSKGQQVILRYKLCRNCGHRILTSTASTERIVRDVSPNQSDDEDDASSQLRIAR